LMLKPECFLCLLMFEIRVPFIWLQPEIPKQADQTCLFLLQRNLKKKKQFLPKFRPSSRMANKRERIDTNKKISRLHWRTLLNSEKIDAQFYLLRSVISKSVLLVCSLWSLVVVVVVVVLLWTSSESYFEFYGLVMNCKSFFFVCLSLSLSLSICVNSLFWVSFFGGVGGSGALIISEAQHFASHSIVQKILK
jgi:hypothetical protein